MHHPRPQHPPSTRPQFSPELVDSHSSSRNTAPSVRVCRQITSEEARGTQGNIRPQRPTMSAHPPMPSCTFLWSSLTYYDAEDTSH
jgi:hypothetical protein